MRPSPEVDGLGQEAGGERLHRWPSRMNDDMLKCITLATFYITVATLHYSILHYIIVATLHIYS